MYIHFAWDLGSFSTAFWLMIIEPAVWVKGTILGKGVPNLDEGYGFIFILPSSEILVNVSQSPKDFSMWMEDGVCFLMEKPSTGHIGLQTCQMNQRRARDGAFGPSAPAVGASLA